VHSLIAGVTELVAGTYTFPSHHGLRLFPTEVTDRSGSVGDALIGIIRGSGAVEGIVYLLTSNLATLDGENGTLATRLIRLAAHH
jgi:hypothetical protein